MGQLNTPTVKRRLAEPTISTDAVAACVAISRNVFPAWRKSATVLWWPLWSNAGSGPGMNEWRAFIAKYRLGVDLTDAVYTYGMAKGPKH